MKTSKTSVRRLAWALSAGISALLLVVGLSLLLSRFQALAQPAAETTVANLKMETSALTCTSQTRSPEKGALITQKGTLTITGVAWEGDNRPLFPGDPELLPINNGYDQNYTVDWTDAISATNYVLYEANNPYFEDATQLYAGSNTDFFVTNKANGTYYYRVKAYNASGGSRWSNVQSAVVGTASASVLTTSIGIAAGDPLTVQVRIDSGDWQTATVTADAGGWWDWSYVWTLPEERYTQHAIQTRASGADGIWGPTDTITVTMNNEIYTLYFQSVFNRWPPLPYAPTLNDISNADEDGNYTVSWSYGHTDPPVVTYTLQEATDANFTNPTNYYPGSNASQAISDQDSGTYYYRVRGHNTWGPGNWSNVKSVMVRSYSYRYNFSSPTKLVNPWPIRRTTYWQGDIAGSTWTEEHDGSLFIIMDDKWDATIASPLEVAPAPPYVLETRVKVDDPANLVAYGVILGGNPGSPCPAYRDTGCLTHYYRLEVIWDGGDLKAEFKRIDYHESDKGKGRGADLISYRYLSADPNGWHTWRFVVKTNGIDVYFDGSLYGSTDDTAYVNEPYFGVFASANEYKPAIGRFDYYYVDPQ